ncbi:unnamed protein product [Cyprideis torosa]|uniref:Uncharacterized protein n=1 Tax=Cyprideis torosa TaxID=163714 RepID=A0A7R8WRB8_9CRUS|nr:unnamed protein product [Cyprideis torosa]CAG0903515.1 unnamed protein product [Cyprideis torosa]
MMAAADEDQNISCDICFELFTTAEDHRPMVICSNGHNLCFSCSGLVNECPTCREQRLPKPIRNLALEKVIKENMLALASVPEIDSTEIDVRQRGQCLGRGSSAEVKAGLWHGEEVAIKVFQIQENDSYLKAMKIEISFATRLQHPNVVRIYGITRMRSDTTAIVMEQADKGSLRVFIGKLSYPKKVAIARGILEGIAYLHSRKVAHRDLKPENILLFGDKLVPKISDFGTSRIVQASMVNTMMTGTPKYCAPELLEEGLRYGTPVDVYSLSLILFELFTGEDPFKGCRSVAQVVAAILRDQRPQIPSDFPEGMKSLLEKGWSKDPLQRPPLTLFRDTLQTLSDDLEKELAKKAAQLKRLTHETPSPESNPCVSEANDPRPRHSMSFAGAAATSADEELEGNHPCESCGAQLKPSRDFCSHKIGCRMLPVPASFSGEPPLSRPQQAQPSRVPSAAPPHPLLALSAMGAGAPPDRSDPLGSVTKGMALKIGYRMRPMPASFSGEPPLSRPQQAQPSRVPSAAPPHPPLAPSTMGAGAPPDRSDPLGSVTKGMALKVSLREHGEGLVVAVGVVV